MRNEEEEEAGPVREAAALVMTDTTGKPPMLTGRSHTQAQVDKTRRSPALLGAPVYVREFIKKAKPKP